MVLSTRYRSSRECSCLVVMTPLLRIMHSRNGDWDFEPIHWLTRLEDNTIVESIVRADTVMEATIDAHCTPRVYSFGVFTKIHQDLHRRKCWTRHDAVCAINARYPYAFAFHVQCLAPALFRIRWGITKTVAFRAC